MKTSKNNDSQISDEDYARLKADEKADLYDPIVGARYSNATDTFAIKFESGVELRIPRTLMSEFDEIPTGSAGLNRIDVLGPGTALDWPVFDIGIHLDHIMAGTFSRKRAMAGLGRTGGKSKTAAKCAAARANGAKGGRPRKNAA